MPRSVLMPTAASIVLLCSVSPSFAQKRSYVGRKLPAIDFLDTEGHTVHPTYYEGSVLVMFTGIPW